jgi:hypothetical protein
LNGELSPKYRANFQTSTRRGLMNSMVESDSLLAQSG